MLNTGGGARVTPVTPHGVPAYLHDYFGPDRTACVLLTTAKDFEAAGRSYREEKPLTGDEARLADVGHVEFPKLLDPIDDRPPVTIITQVRRLDGGKVLVRGTTADNGIVTRVLVNGAVATATREN